MKVFDLAMCVYVECECVCVLNNQEIVYKIQSSA